MALPDDEFEFFFDKPWSDGLPVVPPTEERIIQMLSGTKRSPEESIGQIPPALEEATIYTVGVHAVMAGCKPEYLPILISAMEAILDERLNMNSIQAMMRGGAPLLMVNGPYAKKIGLHGGGGCFGPGFRANATIGRAIRLILHNLGGGIPGVASSTCFGAPSRFAYCIAENEEQSPWEPYSVTKGFALEDNVITIVPCEGPIQVWDDVSQEPERLFITLGDTMSCMGATNIYAQAQMVVVLSVQHAKMCSDAGLSKEDVHRQLCKTAGRKLGHIKRGGIWRGEEGLGRWPFPVDPNDDEFFIPAVSRPEDLHLIVAGGWPGPCSLIMHGVNASCGAVTQKFED